MNTNIRYSRIRRFLLNEDGPTSVEYAVMLALIAAICILAVRALGDGQSGMWGRTVTKLEEVDFITN